MSLKQIKEKIKCLSLYSSNKGRVYLVLIILIFILIIVDICLIAPKFINNREREVLIEKGAFMANFKQNMAISGNYVASKTGKNYYFISCSGVKRIKEENRVFFNTKEDAENRGLIPSKTCSQLWE